MNANFRRDYLYKFKTGAFKDAKLRYLKFDRKTKEYIFIEGATKTKGELAIRVSRAAYIKGRIERLYCIGYENTDQYKLKNTNRLSVRTKPSGRPSLEKKIPRVITKFSDLVIGNTYQFSNLDEYVFISSIPMKFTGNFDSDGEAIFKLSDFSNQYLPKYWLEDNRLTCTLIKGVI